MPFHLRLTRRVEYFNEVTIMICAYHYFCFTDFVSDPETRYTVGLWLILFTCLNMFVNLAVLLISVLLKLANKIRLVTLKKAKIRNRDKKKKERQEMHQKLSQDQIDFIRHLEHIKKHG